MHRTLAICATTLLASSSYADISVSFRDGAPKDRITLTNDACDLTNATLTIDLAETPAGLIFDVTSAGAGVEVFQPVEVTAGAITVRPVVDGAQVLIMDIPSFPRGSAFSLTADLDDTVSNRQITVSGSEMIGASVSLAVAGGVQSAPFRSDGIATLALTGSNGGCPAS